MIYVVSPTHNNLDKTREFIACLQRQTINYKLIIVDCGSTDGTVRWLRDNHQDIQIYELSEDIYCGGAFHYAYERLKNIVGINDVVVLINNDGTFAPDFLSIGKKLTKPSLLVTSIAIDVDCIFDGGIQVNWSKLRFRPSTTPNLCSTRGLFINGKDFAQSGGFSAFLPHYHSDYEFTHRLWNQGFTILEGTDLVIYASGCSGILKPKTLKELFNIRCPENPIYKSIFILLSCPKKYWLVNLLRAWSRVLPCRR